MSESTKERRQLNLSKRAHWDLAVGISGFVYVLLTLSLSLDSPVLSLLFIAVAGYELLAGRPD